MFLCFLFSRCCQGNGQSTQLIQYTRNNVIIGLRWIHSPSDWWCVIGSEHEWRIFRQEIIPYGTCSVYWAPLEKCTLDANALSILELCVSGSVLSAFCSLAVTLVLSLIFWDFLQIRNLFLNKLVCFITDSQNEQNLNLCLVLFAFHGVPMILLRRTCCYEIPKSLYIPLDEVNNVAMRLSKSMNIGIKTR